MSLEEVLTLGEKLSSYAMSLFPGSDVRVGEYTDGSRNYSIWADHPEKVARFIFTFFIDAQDGTVRASAFFNYVKKRSPSVRRREMIFEEDFTLSNFDPYSLESVLSNAASEMRQIVESDSSIQFLNGMTFTDYGGAT